MPQKDSCQPAVIHALQKAGWRVEKEQVMIEYSEDRSPLWADLKLVHPTSAEGIIVVEVKCFQDESSYLRDLYQAIGQYAVYRTALDMRGSSIPLYLALPLSIYEGLLAEPILRETLKRAVIQMIVVDLEEEVLHLWHRSTN